MKKLTLLLAFISISIITNAQKPLVFKYKYLPKHNYRVTAIEKQDGGFNAEIKNATDPTLNPETAGSTMVINTIVDASLNTKDANNGLAVDIKIHDVTVNAIVNGLEAMSFSKENPLGNETIPGKLALSGKVDIDTTKYNDEIKAGITYLNSATNNMIKFPDKPLKIGDTFTVQEDLPLNIERVDLKTEKVTVTYKLIDIKDKLAYFDSFLVCDLKLTQVIDGKDVAITGKGKGSGKVIFNIEKSFPNSIIDNLEMELEAKSANTRITTNMKRNLDYQYIISTR